MVYVPGHVNRVGQTLIPTEFNVNRLSLAAQFELNERIQFRECAKRDEPENNRPFLCLLTPLCLVLTLLPCEHHVHPTRVLHWRLDHS
jgi:hypothetical protein